MLPRLAGAAEQGRGASPQTSPAHMPPDLAAGAAALGTVVCEEMQGRFASRNARAYDNDPEARVWWTQLLPDFVDELRAERDAARAERDAARAECGAFLRQRDAAVVERDAAEAERDDADAVRDATDAARDAAVDEALKWEWRVLRVQQSQQISRPDA